MLCACCVHISCHTSCTRINCTHRHVLGWYAHFHRATKRWQMRSRVQHRHHLHKRYSGSCSVFSLFSPEVSKAASLQWRSGSVRLQRVTKVEPLAKAKKLCRARFATGSLPRLAKVARGGYSDDEEEGPEGPGPSSSSHNIDQIITMPTIVVFMLLPHCPNMAPRLRGGRPRLERSLSKAVGSPAAFRSGYTANPCARKTSRGVSQRPCTLLKSSPTLFYQCWDLLGRPNCRPLLSRLRQGVGHLAWVGLAVLHEIL